mmetsp:Transcript_1982/g.2845  ORF Transcript_1982/g.2845 Transcript_1982/m.2845 type:complete len:561 (+) Transcript_1982:19-1701(+)
MKKEERKILEQLKKKKNTQKEENKKKILKKACQEGYEQVLEELIKLKVNINETMDMETAGKRTSPLMIAIRKGQIEIVKRLLKENVEMEKKNEEGKTALDVAAEKGNGEIIKKLIEKREIINEIEPLNTAIRNGHKEAVNILIEKTNFKINAYTIAINQQEKDIIKRVIIETKKKKMDIKAYEKLTCDIVMNRKKVELFKVLIEHQALNIHYREEKRSLLHLLLLNQVDDEEEEEEHLYDEEIEQMIKEGSVKQLIAEEQRRGSIQGTERYKRRMTALHLAVYHNRTNMFRYFQRKGFNVNVKDQQKNTPLHSAAYHGNAQMINELLESGAIDEKNTFGDMALHRAARQGNFECFLALFEQEHLHCQGTNNDTLLHGGIHKNNPRIIEYLLNLNANMDIKNDQEKTPLDKAIDDNNKKVIILYFVHSIRRNHYEHVNKILTKVPSLVTKDTLTTLLKSYMLLHITRDQQDHRVFYRLIALLIHLNSPDLTNKMINSSDQYGYRPLHYAALYGFHRQTQVLLFLGADPSQPTLYGESPLTLALSNNHFQVVRELLLFDANM